MSVRMTEIFPNPAGVDRDTEWIELCSDTVVSLAGYQLQIGTRTLPLHGVIEAGSCALFSPSPATLRNREAEITLLFNETVIQTVQTAGTASDDMSFHVTATGVYWASSTPGIAASPLPALAPFPSLMPTSSLFGLLGTAAGTAAMLTLLTVFILRYARDRYYALTRGNPDTRR